MRTLPPFASAAMPMRADLLAQRCDYLEAQLKKHTTALCDNDNLLREMRESVETEVAQCQGALWLSARVMHPTAKYATAVDDAQWAARNAEAVSVAPGDERISVAYPMRQVLRPDGSSVVLMRRRWADPETAALSVAWLVVYEGEGGAGAARWCVDPRAVHMRGEGGGRGETRSSDGGKGQKTPLRCSPSPIAPSPRTTTAHRETTVGAKVETMVDPRAVDTRGEAPCAPPRRPLGVVFDVDATLVRQYADSFRAQVAIDPVCELYRACAAAGVACSIVTARADVPEGRDELQRVLRDCAHVPSPRAAYLRPSHVRATAEDLARFKSDCRRRIEDEHGVVIVGNIGDSWHDLLPAPFTAASRELYSLSRERAFGLLPGAGATEASVKLPTE